MVRVRVGVRVRVRVYSIRLGRSSHSSENGLP